MKAEWTNKDSLTQCETTKAIAIFEMPDVCCECPCLSREQNGNCYCGMTFEEIKDAIFVNKPDWCPLRPMPDRKEEGYPNDDYTIGKADGWNDCLDEILGETE